MKGGDDMSEKTKLFDDTAEQAILGAILYSAADCIDKVRLTGLKEDDFYKQVNRALYHSFLQMADDGMHIDIKTVMIHWNRQDLPIRTNSRYRNMHARSRTTQHGARCSKLRVACWLILRTWGKRLLPFLVVCKNA